MLQQYEVLETQAYFENIREEIQTRLNSAQTEIDLAVAWFTDRQLFETLCKKAKSGIKVRLLLFDDEINAKTLSFGLLENAGGRVFKLNQKLMHNKFCIVDRKIVITGSYNWTYKAQNDNYENVAITTGDQFYALQFVEEFNRIIERHFGEKNEATADLGQIIKRLELIRQLIELGDTEDLPIQYRKLRTLNIPDEVKTIIDLLDSRKWAASMALLKDFVGRFHQLVAFVDPEIMGLKLELHALETELTALQNEISETEKTIRDFEHQYNTAIGLILDDILILRRELAQKEAKKEPTNQEKQQIKQEAEKDYQSYTESQEMASQSRKGAKLHDSERRILKNSFREASKLCHPDVVAEEFRAAASDIFSELKIAYESDDLNKTNEILAFLKNGKPFKASHEQNQEKFRLVADLELMQQRYRDSFDLLKMTKQAQLYKTIDQIADWDIYFEKQKADLISVYEKLKEKWKIMQEN